MNHCPCEKCIHSIGGVDCRLNVENECKAGGGFEAWEPAEPDSPESQPESLSYKILKWSALILVWAAYPVMLYRLYLLIFVG